MLRALIKLLLKLFYRVEVKGLDNYRAAGDHALLVTDPGSLIDPLLLTLFLPDSITLAVDRRLLGKWWLRPILKWTEVLPFDFSSPTVTIGMIRAFRERRRCLVFHEQSFRNDPHFLRILEATALIADKMGGTLLPVLIEGSNLSHFSYFRHKQKLRHFPKITLTVLPPQSLKHGGSQDQRGRRGAQGMQLYDIMADLRYATCSIDKTILRALHDAASVFGRRYTILEDHDRHPISYGTLLTKLHVLGRVFARVFAEEERVGFMLPGSTPAVVALMGLHAAGKVPAMINFTAGPSPISSSCRTVQLRSVLTSRKFLKEGGLEELGESISQAGLRLVFLEDLAKDIPAREKLLGAAYALLGIVPKGSPNDPAAILFTSGTEGAPKAVFMSHRNAIANHEQLLSIISVTPGDRMFSSLPMFHVFGLGIGVLLPLLHGMRVFCYPSPLHYRIIPQLFYESMSTVICGTDTFFSGYARYGRAYDFCNARLAIVGAEKMRESTYDLWMKKYGINLIEGYGSTETSPVIAVNTPANRRLGSVGRLVPGTQYKIKPVEGLEGGGELWIKADNVMLGYMRSTSPGVLEPPADGWYDTGDIVEIDEDRFVFIKGRAKRFAKVGGEMISLAAVENALSELYPETKLCVVSVPDPRKGEQLALLIENSSVTTGQISAFFASRGLSPLWTPKRILSVDAVPLLGTGKIDYRTAKEIALAAK